MFVLDCVGRQVHIQNQYQINCKNTYYLTALNTFNQFNRNDFNDLQLLDLDDDKQEQDGFGSNRKILTNPTDHKNQ